MMRVTLSLKFIVFKSTLPAFTEFSLLQLRISETMPPQLPTAAVLQPIRNVVATSALYPLKGIMYFCRHREYWPLFNKRLIPLTITSILVLVLLFMFTYLPQAAFLLIFHGPTGWVSAVFLVLGEGQLIIALLFEAFLVDEACVDVFDVCCTFPPLLCVIHN